METTVGKSSKESSEKYAANPHLMAEYLWRRAPEANWYLLLRKMKALLRG